MYTRTSSWSKSKRKWVTVLPPSPIVFSFDPGSSFARLYPLITLRNTNESHTRKPPATEGIFGIRDLTKIRSGIRENGKYLDGPSGILLLWMVSGIHQNLGTGCRNSSPVCREFGKSYVLEVNKRAFSGVSYESKLHSGRRWLYNWNCQVINRRANSDQRYATVNKTVRALVSLFLAATDESSSARIACLGVQTDS